MWGNCASKPLKVTPNIKASHFEKMLSTIQLIYDR